MSMPCQIKDAGYRMPDVRMNDLVKGDLGGFAYIMHHASCIIFQVGGGRGLLGGGGPEVEGRLNLFPDCLSQKCRHINGGFI